MQEDTVAITTEEMEAKIKDALAGKPDEVHGWYRVGDRIVIGQHVFRVKGVKPTEIRLKLVTKTLK